MTSVLANPAQNPYGVNAAVLSGGNGSNDTTQRAIATIDPRYGNTFTIETKGLTRNNELQQRVFIHLQSAKPNIGALLPGKVINVLVKFAVDDENSPTSVVCSFDTSLGRNLLSLETSGGGSYCAAFSMVADGTQFQVLSVTNDWGYLD